MQYPTQPGDIDHLIAVDDEEKEELPEFRSEAGAAAVLEEAEQAQQLSAQHVRQAFGAATGSTAVPA